MKSVLSNTEKSAQAETSKQAAGKMPRLLLTPQRAAVPAQGGTIEVLLRIQAPDEPATVGDAVKPCAPLRLALVVDRSGSMDGPPLQEALRCVLHIGERLHPADELAVVLYDHEVQVPLPLGRVPGAQAVQQVLAGVERGGSTDLYAGWEAGARQLLLGTPGTVSRVLLLSDGQANHGQTDPGFIADKCRYWLERGVSTTTVGLGHGFNGDLMQAMACAGGGQQYCGQRAEDLFDAFDEELALLQALMGRQLRVRPLPAPGVLVESLGRSGIRDPDGWLTLPDLAWGGDAWTVWRLHVPAQALAGVAPGAPFTALAMALQMEDLAGQLQTFHAAPLVLPVWPASDVAALPADETVTRRLQDVAFVELNLQVREMLQQGKRAQAQAALACAEGQVADHPWLVGKLQRLRDLMASDAAMAQKEMLCSSGKMRPHLALQVNKVARPTDAQMPAVLAPQAQPSTPCSEAAASKGVNASAGIGRANRYPCW